MSTSPAVQAANIINAQSSTGPRTPEGRQRSAANALKTGLFAESPVLPGEDPQPFDDFRTQLYCEHAPATTIEEELVAELANVCWRLKRCQRLENAVLSDETMPIETQLNCLAKYSLYEHRLTRKFTNLLKQLRELQTERQAREEADLQAAIAVAAECKATDTAFIPSQFGFVFSAQEVQVRLNRHERLHAATERGFFAKPTAKRNDGRRK